MYFSHWCNLCVFDVLVGEEPARSGWSCFQNQVLEDTDLWYLLLATNSSRGLSAACLFCKTEAPVPSNLELPHVHNTATKGQTISCGGCIASPESQASLSRDGLLWVLRHLLRAVWIKGDWSSWVKLWMIIERICTFSTWRWQVDKSKMKSQNLEDCTYTLRHCPLIGPSHNWAWNAKHGAGRESWRDVEFIGSVGLVVWSGLRWNTSLCFRPD